MGFFDNDSFFGGGIEEIFNKLANGNVEYLTTDSEGNKVRYKNPQKNHFEKFFLERITTKNGIYLIFDLNGFEEINIEINKDQLTKEKILEVYSENKLLFSFPIEDIKSKKPEKKFYNGILEVYFKK